MAADQLQSVKFIHPSTLRSRRSFGQYDVSWRNVSTLLDTLHDLASTWHSADIDLGGLASTPLEIM
jgi:hypothetical protein